LYKYVWEIETFDIPGILSEFPVDIPASATFLIDKELWDHHRWSKIRHYYPGYSLFYWIHEVEVDAYEYCREALSGRLLKDEG